MNVFRRALASSSLAVLGLATLTVAQATPAAELAGRSGTVAVASPTAAGWAQSLWDAARRGDLTSFDALLLDLDNRTAADGVLGDLREDARAFREHIAKRETDRAARMIEVRADLDKVLAEPLTDITLGKALRAAIELHVLSADKDSLLVEPGVIRVIARADAAAHAAEARGNVLTAGELFVLLDVLLDVKGTYKPAYRRLVQRQEMLRLYVPQRLWELRNERQKAAGEDPLPPYNAFGDDYRTKLASIDPILIIRAMGRARQHVEQQPVASLIAGGLEAVVTMVTTTDLQAAFPGLGEASARDAMLATVEGELAALAAKPGGSLDQIQIEQIIDRVRRQNTRTVGISDQALLHEFGNGAMGRLDEPSQIIWPDEVRRFERNTQSRFVGIGVSIEYDELQNIRVITPLEGTPAQRAGVHPGDVIKKVDGRALFGLSLDQAVDIITGPQGTDVNLTLERRADGQADAPLATTPGEAGGVGKAKVAKDDSPKVEIDVRVTRDVIKVPTVKGWKREGVREDAWDWFVDRDHGIGYVRLSQFADTTSDELDRAVREMRRSGLKGLVLDLRFNPGGLLDQAVKVARKFIAVKDGVIVMTRGAGGTTESPEYTKPAQASLANIPLVVLVNEGSASASEIVSGAISTYAKAGELDALVVGGRSYGKGSVQNVWPLTATAMMKVTTAYYMLPDKRIIHRRPGALTWGIEPNLKVEMLPRQTAESITVRRNADVIPLDESGKSSALRAATRPDPDDLLSKGVDLQLGAAVLLLKSRVATGATTAQSEK